MQYIVLDLEWNQPWPGSYSAKKVLPSPIRGEIVQIGAVRMSCEGTVADEFQMLIRPAYYKKMNRKVASLTGIKDAILKEQGKPFPEAMQAFHDWCGEDSAFLTWGFDDIVILKENLTLYGMDTAWVDKWYNAQLIFNAQTDGSSAQKALGSAMPPGNTAWASGSRTSPAWVWTLTVCAPCLRSGRQPPGRSWASGKTTSFCCTPRSFPAEKTRPLFCGRCRCCRGG